MTVVLAKTSSHRSVIACARQAGLRYYFVTKLVGTETFAFFSILTALSDERTAYNTVLKAMQHAIPQMTVSGKSSTKTSPLPPYFCFAYENNPLATCNLIIFVDESLAINSTIPPRWIREKLGGVERKAVSLIALNAFVSTLGGGHYLCKHVKDAWSMALGQQAIAIALGDMELAGQCRIHLAYICMQMGKLKAAKRRLESERAFGVKIGSEKLLAVVHAAEVYLS